MPPRCLGATPPARQPIPRLRALRGRAAQDAVSWHGKSQDRANALPGRASSWNDDGRTDPKRTDSAQAPGTIRLHQPRGCRQKAEPRVACRSHDRTDRFGALDLMAAFRLAAKLAVLLVAGGHRGSFLAPRRVHWRFCQPSELSRRMRCPGTGDRSREHGAKIHHL